MTLTPKRHLSLYLMKKGTSVDQAIRDPSKVEKHELSDSALEGALFVKTNPSSVPWWVEFLDPLSVDNLVAPASRSTSAVLSLRLRNGRQSNTVCFTFGHGRHLLDPNRVDRSFGLRVALNTVDPLKLRGFDARRQDDIVVNSRVQSTTGTDLATFGLDLYRDIVTRATGVTLEDYESDLGTRVHGSVGVVFDVRIFPEDLPERARRVLSIYQREDYKETFSFVDNMQPVDPAIVEDLNARLDQEFLTAVSHSEGTFRCFYLAAPEVLDFESLEGFTFSSERGSRKTVHVELKLDDYLETRRHRSDPVDVALVRRDRVSIRVEGDSDRFLATVYKCIIAEVEHNDALFQLVDGVWYRIEPSFVSEIRQRVLDIPTSSIEFPNHRDGDTEMSYNQRVAENLDGLLMDCRNIPLGGGRSRIEFCDVMLNDRTLIHAKKRSGSSTLSHLWSQGTVAMQALLSDEEFRARVRSKICAINPAFEHVVAEEFSRADYELVYLIIGVNGGHPASGLPFFSQVALSQAIRSLDTMGVRAHIAGVRSVPG